MPCSSFTCEALGKSLKHLMETVPLPKISVKDVTDGCGLNRQTFYYHFKNIYDLLVWICRKEIIDRIEEKGSGENWRENISSVFTYILENRKFCQNAVRTVEKTLLERFLYDNIYRLVFMAIKQNSAGVIVPPDEVQFIADFYTPAFMHLVLSWIRGETGEKPQTVTERLEPLVSGILVTAVSKYNIYDITV